MTPVEFRNKEDQPTEQGWYWAREIDGDLHPVPVLVIEESGRLCVIRVGSVNDYPIPDYDWFGSLTMVREG